MPNYVQRYQQGYHQQVWEELVAQEARIYEEPLRSEAYAVARLMMEHARYNIECLVERLTKLHYRFAARPWSRPDPQLLKQLDAIEHQHGRLPLVARVWFEIVGQVSLRGSHPTLSNPSRSDITDPMEIRLKDVYVDTIDQHARSFLALGEDPVLKSGEMCEGGPMSVILPAPGFDAPFYAGDSWAERYGGSMWDGEYFIPYLRRCFAHGGFPGMSRDDLAAYYEDELGVLTKDLRPL